MDTRVDTGNLITGGQTGATLLTLIVSIDPIRFVFDASEADYLRYVRLRLAGSAQATGESELKGTLTPGRLADFVVLGANPTTRNSSS